MMLQLQFLGRIYCLLVGLYRQKSGRDISCKKVALLIFLDVGLLIMVFNCMFASTHVRMVPVSFDSENSLYGM